MVLSQDDCPKDIYWSDDGLERDLYIQTSTVTVLAMDGRRRWLDLNNLVSFSNNSSAVLRILTQPVIFKFLARCYIFLM